VEQLRPLVAKHASRLMKKANVVGVGIGYKETGDRVTGEQALVVLVTKKCHPTRLARADKIPKALSEVKTDVIEVGELKILPAAVPENKEALEEIDRKARHRPARPGISVGHYQVTAGTFGALVYDAETRLPMLLSNNHVLANITDGRDGRAKQGDPIYQPGRYDGGGRDDAIAHLERFVPIVRTTAEETCPIARQAERVGNFILRHTFAGHELRFSRKTGKDNLVDAAVAALINPDDAIPDIVDIGPVNGTATPTPGLKVMKSGRTSAITRGVVRLIGASVRVGLGEVGSAVFNDQIVTTAIAQPGDSGSLVVTEDGHQAVGLLSAGSSQATILSDLGHVFSLLGVTL
jgi:hypothetical protein